MISNVNKIGRFIARSRHFTSIRSSSSPAAEFPTTRFYNRDQYDYVIVLPEAVSDTPDKNESLRIPRIGDNEIRLDKINLQGAYKGINLRIIEFRKLLDDLEDAPDDARLSDLFSQIEEKLYQLDCCGKIIGAYIRNQPGNFGNDQLYKTLKRSVDVRHKRTKKKMKSIIDSHFDDKFAKLNTLEMDLVKIYCPFNLNNERPRAFEEVSCDRYEQELEKSIDYYRRNVFEEDKVFSHIIDDPDVLAQLSSESTEFQESHQRERAPFEVNPGTYSKLMQICPDRPTRQFIWQLYKKRCSPTSVFNNEKLANEIILYRKNIAVYLGYENHMNRILTRTKFKSKANIEEHLDRLNAANQVEMGDRLVELKCFAIDNGATDIEHTGLAEYDIDYWIHKFGHEKILNKSEADIKKLFPLNGVVGGLVKFYSDYFGIELRAMKFEDKALPQATRFYEIHRSNHILGRLALIIEDNLNPLNITRMETSTIRPRNARLDIPSYSLLKLNCVKNPTTGDILLGPQDIMQLIFYLSLAIQNSLLSIKTYELNNWETRLDLLPFFPLLAVTYLMNDPRIIQSLTQDDHNTDTKIDMSYASKILDSMTYHRSFKLWREFYMAHLDLEYHGYLVDARKKANALYSTYSPFRRNPYDYDFCTMSEIFTNSSGGLSFSTIWCKQLINFHLNKMNFGKPRELSLCNIDKMKESNTKLIDGLFESYRLDFLDDESSFSSDTGPSKFI